MVTTASKNSKLDEFWKCRVIKLHHFSKSKSHLRQVLVVTRISKIPNGTNSKAAEIWRRRQDFDCNSRLQFLSGYLCDCVHRYFLNVTRPALILQAAGKGSRRKYQLSMFPRERLTIAIYCGHFAAKMAKQTIVIRVAER